MAFWTTLLGDESLHRHAQWLASAPGGQRLIVERQAMSGARLAGAPAVR